MGVAREAMVLLEFRDAPKLITVSVLAPPAIQVVADAGHHLKWQAINEQTWKSKKIAVVTEGCVSHMLCKPLKHVKCP